MDHRMILSRVVWHFNHYDQRFAIESARAAGYLVETIARHDYDETRFSYDGQTVGFMHAFYAPPSEAEAFLFLFECEAVTPFWSRLRWRLTHPFADLTELPWPAREAGA